jgi:hypothetical protein
MLPKWPNDGSSHKNAGFPLIKQPLALEAAPLDSRVPQENGAEKGESKVMSYSDGTLITDN